jgi:hypothetical protein
LRAGAAPRRSSAEARVSERTIDDAVKVRDVGTPEFLDAEKGKISAGGKRPSQSAKRW